MKKNKIKLALILINLIPFSLLAVPLGTRAKVDKVTVYLNGAQLFSNHSFNLTQGITDIVFDGVSPNLQASSLQASGKGSFVIMDVKYDVQYPEQVIKKNPESKILKQIKQLDDSLVELGFQIEEMNDKLNALQLEKNILLNNRLIKGETKRDTLSLFKDAMEFLRAKQTNINAEIYIVKRLLNNRNNIIEELNQRLSNYQNLVNQVNENIPSQVANHRVTVTVMAEVMGAANITINYFVASASWMPSYDLRGNNNSNTIQLTQKASITQNTGVDWNNASITLATAAPMQNTIKPNLMPAYLSFYRAAALTKMKSESIVRNLSSVDDSYNSKALPSEDLALSEAKFASDFTSVLENMINTEYEIKLKYEIPSDGKTHLVIVQNKELKANYNFSAVPKLDASAYLIAKIIDWEELNLIAGTSRIYFDGTYLGESSIDPNSTNDTLQLSFGRDKGIVITRKKLKDKTKEKILLEEKSITISYEITVKNTKNMAVSLSLEDQIPLSTEPAIEIKIVDGSKARYMHETGGLFWDINLKPKETRKITFSYEVKMSKDKSIAGL